MNPRWRWTIWFVLFALWTIGLTRPIPDFTEIVGDEAMQYRFHVAKTLHVAVYAGLTVLTAWLRAPMRWRIALMFFLMAHATVTEHIQLFVEGRIGHLHDVGLDNLGVLAGLIVSWKWWSADEDSQ